jgi:DnaJ family protein C protein 13
MLAAAGSPAAAAAGGGATLISGSTSQQPTANGNAAPAVSASVLNAPLPQQQQKQQQLLLQQQQQQQMQPPQQAPVPGSAQASLRTLRAVQAVGGLKGNWGALWAAAVKDHCHAGLIWNESTRRELRDALEREEAGLRAARTRVAKVCVWE